MQILLNNKGDTGVGIQNISSTLEGYLVITMTDGTVYTVGVSACQHVYETEKVFPTCETQGYIEYTCTLCGLHYTNDYTPASGHHFADGYCVFCEAEEPFGEIEHDISWYDSSLSTFALTTRGQLAGLAYLVNNGTNFSGKTVTLGNHIDLDYNEWTPIGTKSKPFAGTFNGKNFTIYNLKITKAASYVGLFGYVTGSIYGFNVSNASVNVSNTQSHVAIACAYSGNGLKNIAVSGEVNAPDASYVGGVVAEAKGAVNNCANHANVIGYNYVGGVMGDFYNGGDYLYENLNNTGIIKGNNNVGGIIGFMNNTTTQLRGLYNNAEIVGKENTGGLIGYLYAVTVNGEELHNTGNVTGSMHVGGAVGYGKADQDISAIINSSSSAKIEAECYVGGLAGTLSNIALNNCSNEGSSISANSHKDWGGTAISACLGGYVGNGFKISNCVNDVNLNYTGIGCYVGGIAGHAYSNITDCVNNGEIFSTSDKVGGIVGGKETSKTFEYLNLINTGNVTAKDKVGGIVGWLYADYGYYGLYTFTAQGLKNSGKIHGKNQVGGLIGYVRLYNNFYENDNYIVAISDVMNSGNIIGDNEVGGLIGYAYSDTDVSYITGYTMTGTVTAPEGATVADLIGANTNITIK